MRRRELLITLGGAAAAAPALRAETKPVPLIGYLHAIKPPATLVDQFRDGLAEQGYFEGQNLAIEYRSAEGHYDRLPSLAAALVLRGVDLIAAFPTVSARAAKAATNMIPIVALMGADPLSAGLSDSLSHPSGNLTGISQLVSATDAKRLELLHELVPNARTIAYLENPTLWNAQDNRRTVEAAAGTLGVTLFVADASREDELIRAFAAMAKQRPEALLIGTDPFFLMERDRFVAIAEQMHLPTMYFFREFVTAGGLISYGTSLGGGYRQVGIYVGKILHGAKPADLPIAQQSEKVELVVNLKTAKALDLTIPPLILARADEVIE
jgi:putative tryptophan/tyrosine transport system substrate-binding protein